MPRLTCRSCGRQVYTVAPLESLFAEERRCPRCGALMHAERRETERRANVRRKNPSHDPGPPVVETETGTGTGTAERRASDRRATRRRGGGQGAGSAGTPPPVRNDQTGWQD